MRKQRGRRTFDVFAVWSLLLLIVITVLCASSFFLGGWVRVFESSKTNVFLGSARGTFVIKRNTIEGPAEAVFVPIDAADLSTLPEADMLHVRAGSDGQLAFVGIGPSLRPCWLVRIEPLRAPRLTLQRRDGSQLTVTARIDQVSVSYLLVMLPLTILPALWYRRHRLQCRLLRGLCSSCGYDLRATPERCPECGKAALAPSPSGREFG